MHDNCLAIMLILGCNFRPKRRLPRPTQMITDPDILKIADLALLPPALNTSPLPKYGYDKLDYSLSGSIECTNGGRLWVCWIAGGDNEKAFLVFATSDDSGDTWSQPRLVIDPHDEGFPMARSSVSGTLWLDPQGRLWAFFTQSMAQFDGRMGVWATRCDDPDAEHPEWTAPKRLWHGFPLNKPIVDSSGDWLLPIVLWQRAMLANCSLECVAESGMVSMLGEIFQDLDHLRMCHVLASSDLGETWERRGGVLFPSSKDFEEPVIVERRDGTIWMIVRTSDKGMWQSLSKDKGRTWTPEEPWLANVNSRHHLGRLPSGRILLLKHGIPVETTPKSRSHLTAYLSEDDGATWLGGLILDERDGVSYPDCGITKDGRIFVAYDRNRDTDGEILLARFREEDVLAGQCASPGSALKMLVTKPNPENVAKRHAVRKDAMIRRLIGADDTSFVHIPQWRAWAGVGKIDTTKLNVNNGTTLPALNDILPPEDIAADNLAWLTRTPAGAGDEGREGFVSFGESEAPGEGKLGYARSYIYSPTSRDAAFLLGADYWMQFRINGETYVDHAKEMRPGWTSDLYEFRCDAPLRAGWNLLEVKVASGSLGFAFACQVDEAEGVRFSVAPELEPALV